MSRTYYETLSAYSDRPIVTVTFLDGENAGKKQIFCEGQQIYPRIEKQADAKMGREAPGDFGTGILRMSAGNAFAERLGQPPVCVICGAGHVGIPVIRLARLTGFEVVVIEDRPSFADKARAAGATKVLCDSFERALAQIEGGRQVYFVVMTRGHRYDEDCLSIILKKPHAYVGMMASRGRGARMKQNLIEKGFSEETVSNIHTPIGLSIHAKTPEEIGISVLAELIAVKNSGGGGTVFDKEILENILNKACQEPWALATIIRRSGSAPREIGTKMLVTDIGTTVGSVGGGCMEAKVIREGLGFLRIHREDKSKVMKRMTADMSGAEAEVSGMVCGGRIEVLLEVVN